MLEIEKKVNDTEKTTNKLSLDLAETRLSAKQANKNIEILQTELVQKIQSEVIGQDKTSAEIIRTAEVKNEKGVQKVGPAKVPGEVKKAGTDAQGTIINDIKYYKVSDSQDKVLVYVSVLNNPRMQTLRGTNPRIVLDFFNTSQVGKERYEIRTEGNFIKKIRVRTYREPQQKVRLVFDMVLNKKYSIERSFSKKDNVYAFDLKAN